MKKVMIIVLILVGALIVPAVSAETETFMVRDEKFINHDFSIIQSDTYSWLEVTSFNLLTIPKPNEVSSGATLVCFRPISISDPTITSNSADFDIYRITDNEWVGTANIGYYRNPTGVQYIWIMITDWQDTKRSVKTTYSFSSIGDNKNFYSKLGFSFPNDANKYKHGYGDSLTTPYISYKYTDAPLRLFGAIGDYTWNSVVQMKNDIIIDYNPNPKINEFVYTIDKIDIIREIGGTQYTSTVKTQSLNESGIVYTNSGSINHSVNISASDRPYTISVYSPTFDKYYNMTFGAGSEEPTPTNNASVTVYIRNSQTGALLADAHIEIQDTTTDPWTEVANQTLSSGQVTMSLTKDPGIHFTQYRIGATVPGYQQVVPALFFRVVGPTNVVVEMEPVEGGPVNEDNTYLEFYVRDLNANGIPNANVHVDGQLRWTNAQGYTQIEVAKNASYHYSVSKSGYVTIEGRATVADGPRYVVNVVLGPGTVPTNPPATPTLGPGETPGGPGATPTPDHRTNEQKGQAVIDMIADNAEGIGALALICLLLGLLKLMVKW
jgi:hypothetical protein